MVYEEIYNFCTVRNKGSVFSNEVGCFTPRVKFILDLLDKLKIPYEVDVFTAKEGIAGFNIIMLGESERWVTAHHDIVNPLSDNANDNSCSVINAIALKTLLPEVNVAIIDGEEFGGLGSQRLSKQMLEGNYGDVEWILNLELTGRGGKNFLLGESGAHGKLGNSIKELFKCFLMRVPFNDSIVFRQYGFDSLVINPLPLKEDGNLDTSVLYLCHSIEDSVNKISIEDMKEFTEEVLVPI
ncbi:MAG: M28 family peptidase, partial [Candidatus Thorarchaeota archaeon]